MSRTYAGLVSVSAIRSSTPDTEDTRRVKIKIDDLDSAAWQGDLQVRPAGLFDEGDALVVLLEGSRIGQTATGRVTTPTPETLTILGFQAFS